MDNTRAHRPKRQLSIIAILIVAVATPATLSLSYYQITGDPTFRPLALTVERMIAGGQVVQTIEVQAVITTDGSDAGAERGRQLGRKLVKAFYGKGLGAHAILRPAPEPGPPQVYFIVNRSSLGPFTERTAAQGVRIAAEAAAITRRAENDSPEHSW